MDRSPNHQPEMGTASNAFQVHRATCTLRLISNPDLPRPGGRFDLEACVLAARPDIRAHE